jgi:hypothetical protein
MTHRKRNKAIMEDEMMARWTEQYLRLREMPDGPAKKFSLCKAYGHLFEDRKALGRMSCAQIIAAIENKLGETK